MYIIDRRLLLRINTMMMETTRSRTHSEGDRVELDDSILSRKKHRRGKKRCRPKWKPYSKMSLEERKELEEWEARHVAIREAEINARSKRPVAPFNSTQFLIEDHCENQFSTNSRPLRTRSYSEEESSSSGENEHYEPLDVNDEEQEAFFEADFNQVYLQLQLNRLEGMSKQDLISQCCTLEEKVSSIEQEKLELASQLESLKQANGKLLKENNQLKEIDTSTNSNCNH